MLGIPRSLFNRALCGALLVTAACSGGNVVLDTELTDSGMNPSTATDAGENGGGNGNNGGNNGNANGNNGPNATGGSNGPDVVIPEVDSGTMDAGMDSSMPDAGDTPHPLAGKYAVRTVIYARQKAEVADTQLDLISEGTLLSVVDIDDKGLASEHYCFIETTNANDIVSWTRPAATEKIPDSKVQLKLVGSEYVREQASDLTYVSWSPIGQPADCVKGATHSTGCLCGDPDRLPVDAKDCRVLDLDGDLKPGGALYVGTSRPVDPATSAGVVKLSIVGKKAIELRIPNNQTGARLIGKITGGIEQSEVGREPGTEPEPGQPPDTSLLNLFSRIRNSICPGEYGHVELVRGDHTCASLLAARTDTNFDGYGVFDTTLDSDFGQEVDENDQPIEVDKSVCPDPDLCPDGEMVRCGVCGGSFPEGTCDCEGTPPPTWYSDSVDKDGLGDPNPDLSVEACVAPDDFVSNSDDLDPGCSIATTRNRCGVCDGPVIAPGTCCPTEVLDECGVCNGPGKNGKCDCAGTSPATWYADTDGDGFGDPAATTKVECAQPAGYVATAGDLCPNDKPKQTPGTCGCAKADTDTDGDLLADCNDACPDDPKKQTIGLCGCGVLDTNTDGDAQADCTDQCDNDASKVVAGRCGCGVVDATADPDSDSVCGATDGCPNDGAKSAPGRCGCGVVDATADADGDSVCGAADACPNDNGKSAPGRCGCGVVDATGDPDSDNVCGAADACPSDPAKAALGRCGCGVVDATADSDGDSVCGAADACPSDPNKGAAGRCGCGINDTTADPDSDSVCGAADACPNDGRKSAPGRCGCGVVDASADPDSDNVCGAADACPNDPNKTAVGRCGCGVNDTASDPDSDSVCGAADACPNDPAKSALGLCGCGVADIDRNNDGTVTVVDCTDNCPNDPNKVAPGRCGCGVVDNTADPDADSVCGAADACPSDPNKSAVGRCGCGISDAMADSDGDSVCGGADACPNDPNKGSAGRCGCGVVDATADPDADNVCGGADACPNDPNKSVVGRCGCGVVDATADPDSDSACGAADACPNDPNKSALGRCGCGVVDATADADADSVCGAADACPNDPAKGSLGRCGCGVVDASADPDGDSVCGTADACPADPAKSALGICGCGVADTNSDSDTLANCQDNCDNVANQNQADFNTDGQGDVCDDTDGDSVLDATDNCRSVSNNTQTNTDGDANGGDACDTDDDNDGALDTADSCPLIANADQLNTDGDATGDACDADDDNDGTPDSTDGCPINAPKTAPGLCGCAVAEGSCGTTNPLPGTYAVRSMIYNRSRDDLNDTSISDGKTANFSIITITANADGTTFTLSDRGCWTNGRVGANYSWSASDWVQAVDPVVRQVTPIAAGKYLRNEVLTYVGWNPANTCRTTPAFPAYNKTNSNFDCRLVDEDKDGKVGVSAIASTSPPNGTNQKTGTATVMAAANARNTWTISPSANGRHTATVADKGTVSGIVGCSGGFACSLGLGNTQPLTQICPEPSNVAQFIPVAELNDNGGEYDCSELLAENLTTVFGAEPAYPTAAQCPWQ